MPEDTQQPPATDSVKNPNGGFFASDNAATASAPQQSIEPVTWTAKEFIGHDKTIVWYLILAAVTLGLAAGLYFLDKITSIMVIIAGIFLGYYARRKPRELDYRVDQSGIYVGNKLYPYEHFKSYALMPEAGFYSLVFLPIKRFSLPLTLYHAPEHQESLMAILSDRLPMEDRQPDALERIMQRIRF